MTTRQTRIFAPPSGRFDTAYWAETLVGTILVPVLKEYQGIHCFWFSRYDCTAENDSGDCDINIIKQHVTPMTNGHFRSVRFRYRVSKEAAESFEARLQEQISKLDCHVSDFRSYDWVGDLGGERHLAAPRSSERKQARADLVGECYCSISKLVIATLVGPDADGRYSPEVNDNNQNPQNSTFESIHHLFCNISAVPLRVYLTQEIGTSWMPLTRVAYPVDVRF